MVNEHNNLPETEHIEVGRLIGTLGRVQAPKDFDFQVRARIAIGKPQEKRASWFPATVRFAAPLGLLLAVGGYVGYNSVYSTDVASVPVVAYAPAEPGSPVNNPVAQDQPVVNTEVIADQTLAEAKPETTPDRILKTGQKTPAVTEPKNEKPGGGSYDTAATDSKKINAPDIDDLAPAPKRVLISAKDFLSSIGVSASSTGTGGRIQSVGGSAAAVGIMVGDVIESISVQTRTIRVTRDGKSLAFSIR